MGVLQVPSDTVFSAVLKLCSRMDDDMMGQMSISATLLSAWARELALAIPISTLKEGDEPSSEWDADERYFAMKRIVNEILCARAPEDPWRANMWIQRLRALALNPKDSLQANRAEILRPTFH